MNGRELVAGLAAHFLVDPLQPFDKAADVVLAVAVVPDVVDDFGEGPRTDRPALGRDRGGLLESFEQRAAETIEDGEVRFVGVLFPLARAAAEHLLEQNAGTDRAQEHDDFQIGDVDAGGHEIDRDDDARVLAIAEFADALQRPIDAAGDLLHEGVAAAEHVAADGHELVGVRDVR